MRRRRGIYPGLVVLAAQREGEPGLARFCVSGQWLTCANIPRCRTCIEEEQMEIDTLEGVQLGGITQWIRVYSAADVIRTLRGISASQAALLPQLATTDLVRTMPRLDVRLVMAQGRLDQVAPGEAAQRFHDSLTAPSKQLVWFESSAHTPHLEEPARFRDLLMNVRASQPAGP